MSLNAAGVRYIEKEEAYYPQEAQDKKRREQEYFIQQMQMYGYLGPGTPVDTTTTNTTNRQTTTPQTQATTSAATQQTTEPRYWGGSSTYYYTTSTYSAATESARRRIFVQHPDVPAHPYADEEKAIRETIERNRQQAQPPPGPGLPLSGGAVKERTEARLDDKGGEQRPPEPPPDFDRLPPDVQQMLLNRQSRQSRDERDDKAHDDGNKERRDERGKTDDNNRNITRPGGLEDNSQGGDGRDIGAGGSDNVPDNNRDITQTSAGGDSQVSDKVDEKGREVKGVLRHAFTAVHPVATIPSYDVYTDGEKYYVYKDGKLVEVEIRRRTRAGFEIVFPDGTSQFYPAVGDSNEAARRRLLLQLDDGTAVEPAAYNRLKDEYVFVVGDKVVIVGDVRGAEGKPVRGAYVLQGLSQDETRRLVEFVQSQGTYNIPLLLKEFQRERVANWLREAFGVEPKLYRDVVDPGRGFYDYAVVEKDGVRLIYRLDTGELKAELRTMHDVWRSVSPEVAIAALRGGIKLEREGNHTYIVLGDVKVPATRENLAVLDAALREGKEIHIASAHNQLTGETQIRLFLDRDEATRWQLENTVVALPRDVYRLGGGPHDYYGRYVTLAELARGVDIFVTADLGGEKIDIRGVAKYDIETGEIKIDVKDGYYGIYKVPFDVDGKTIWFNANVYVQDGVVYAVPQDGRYKIGTDERGRLAAVPTQDRDADFYIHGGTIYKLQLQEIQEQKDVMNRVAEHRDIDELLLKYFGTTNLDEIKEKLRSTIVVDLPPVIRGLAKGIAGVERFVLEPENPLDRQLIQPRGGTSIIPAQPGDPNYWNVVATFRESTEQAMAMTDEKMRVWQYLKEKGVIDEIKRDLRVFSPISYVLGERASPRGAWDYVDSIIATALDVLFAKQVAALGAKGLAEFARRVGAKTVVGKPIATTIEKVKVPTTIKYEGVVTEIPKGAREVGFSVAPGRLEIVSPTRGELTLVRVDKFTPTEAARLELGSVKIFDTPTLSPADLRGGVTVERGLQVLGRDMHATEPVRITRGEYTPAPTQPGEGVTLIDRTIAGPGFRAAEATGTELRYVETVPIGRGRTQPLEATQLITPDREYKMYEATLYTMETPTSAVLERFAEWASKYWPFKIELQRPYHGRAYIERVGLDDVEEVTRRVGRREVKVEWKDDASPVGGEKSDAPPPVKEMREVKVEWTDKIFTADDDKKLRGVITLDRLIPIRRRGGHVEDVVKTERDVGRGVVVVEKQEGAVRAAVKAVDETLPAPERVFNVKPVVETKIPLPHPIIRLPQYDVDTQRPQFEPFFSRPPATYDTVPFVTAPVFITQRGGVVGQVLVQPTPFATATTTEQPQRIEEKTTQRTETTQRTTEVGVTQFEPLVVTTTTVTQTVPVPLIFRIPIPTPTPVTPPPPPPGEPPPPPVRLPPGGVPGMALASPWGWRGGYRARWGERLII
ncbi:MAG: hypothetical protein QW512_00755 [Thermofilaceae archaeon]